MPEPSRPPDRTAELHDRAVRRLLAAHAANAEEPLVLAVRYHLPDRDIHLLEVIDGFPGPPDEPPLRADFAASPDLRILGTVHLVLLGPEQLRAAVTRGDTLIEEVRRDGRVEYQSADATELVDLLGVDTGVSSSERRARRRLLDELGSEDRATEAEMGEIRRRWRG
jgi:hypothetical protein